MLYFRTTLDNSIEQCSNILHFHSMEDSDKRISRKVIMLIQNLLVRYFYHREITKGKNCNFASRMNLYICICDMFASTFLL